MAKFGKPVREILAQPLTSDEPPSREREDHMLTLTKEDWRTLRTLVFHGQEHFPKLNASMLVRVLIRILAEHELDLDGISSEGALQDRISKILSRNSSESPEGKVS